MDANDDHGQPLAFGDVLRRYRAAAGWTQEELAARAGVSERSINGMERGIQHVPRKDTVRLLADALRLSPSDRAAFEAAARRRVLVGTPPILPPPETILPLPPTPLIGRERDVIAVEDMFRHRHARMLTLTGPAGVGKTRLGLQVAADLAAEFVDGVAFVALASSDDPASVIPAIARALGVRDTAGQALRETVRGYLCGRHILLLLDNFEHVMAAAPAVADLLSACPRLAVLATSRAAVHVRGEREYAVPPLAVPHPSDVASPADLAGVPAVALFLERAREVKPDFALTPLNAATVAAICARLDGLPLALELAAPRLKLLPPRALLTRLDHCLSLLSDGASDLPARQRTMRDAIAWSYYLLPPDEQALFRRLAVFAGGCRVEAAHAVCAGAEASGDDASSQGDADDALRRLASLLDKNLVRRDDARREDEESDERDGGDDLPRIDMLRTIRAYALEQLMETDEWDTIHGQHAAYYVRLAERAEPQLVGPRQGMWLRRLEREHDNLREAIQWAAARGERDLELRLIAALWPFWLRGGYVSEGRLLIEDALTRAADADLMHQVRVFYGAGCLAQWQGEHGRARTWLDRALALARTCANLGGIAASLHGLGTLARIEGRAEEATDHLSESLAVSREGGDARARALALEGLGEVARLEGDDARGEALVAEGLALLREIGDIREIVVALCTLAVVAERRGDDGRATALLGEGIALCQGLGDRSALAHVAELVARVVARRQQAECVARLLGAAEALREVVGLSLDRIERVAHDQAVASVRQALNDRLFAAEWTGGRALAQQPGQLVAHVSHTVGVQ